MKNSAPKFSVIAMLFASPIALLAQTNNPFVGKWQLNVSKSKFNPGPAIKSETVTNLNGKTSAEGIDGSGQPFKWSFAPSQGTTVPIEGMENSTVEENFSSNTLDHTWKMAGGNVKGHGLLSKDGKILTYKQTGTDGQGHPVHNLLIFERQ